MRCQPSSDVAGAAADIEYPPAAGEPDELSDHLLRVRGAKVVDVDYLRVGEHGAVLRAPGERLRIHRHQRYAPAVAREAHLVNLRTVEYREALVLQHSVAAAVADGSAPDTVLLLEHPPTITLGRRTEEGEVHVPPGAQVEIVEVDRGGKSTYHGPGQLVC